MRASKLAQRNATLRYVTRRTARQLARSLRTAALVCEKAYSRSPLNFLKRLANSAGQAARAAAGEPKAANKPACWGAGRERPMLNARRPGSVGLGAAERTTLTDWRSSISMLVA